MPETTIQFFCARCNQMTRADLGIHIAPIVNLSPAGEPEEQDFRAKCLDCGHEVRFPAGEDLAGLIAEHNKHNMPRLLADPETGEPLPSQAQLDALAKAAKVHGS